MDKRALLLIPALLTACIWNETEPVEGTEFCQAAQDNLEALDCRNPDDTPMWINEDGEEFAVTCRIIQKQGGIFIDPECVATAATCEEANECPPTS